MITKTFMTITAFLLSFYIGQKAFERRPTVIEQIKAETLKIDSIISLVKKDSLINVRPQR